MKTDRTQLRELLLSDEATSPQLGLVQKRSALRQLLLSTYSATKPNQQAVKLCHWGRWSQAPFSDRPIVGFGLASSKHALVDVMHALENSPMPREVQQQLPTLSEDEWDAATRMMTLLLYTLQEQDERSLDSEEEPSAETAPSKVKRARRRQSPS
ncbi:hypothetical protein D7Y23_10210 [Corallococcus sp. AB050B]|nr:hypothetical protein D7Y23_10210 [Corallococcus sp. AB050B]